MIERRPLESFGVTRNARLEAYHHFCFAAYEHPDRMRWGGLRVLNYNVLARGADVAPQPQDNMEIFTWVRRGVIGHSGSLGKRHHTVAGEVQLISAGSGIVHNDANLGNRSAEYLEIWLPSDQAGGEPARRVTRFPDRDRAGQLVTLASGFPGDRDALTLRSNARIMGARLPIGSSFNHTLLTDRRAYIVAATGKIDINGVRLGPLEGAAIHNEPNLKVTALKGGEVILIDVR